MLETLTRFEGIATTPESLHYPHMYKVSQLETLTRFEGIATPGGIAPTGLHLLTARLETLIIEIVMYLTWSYRYPVDCKNDIYPGC